MIRTAESVSPRHPDKMCDRISDSILDAYLRLDRNARVAVETMGGHGRVYITGEVSSKKELPTEKIEQIVHKITGKKERVYINIVKQSSEIANGVDTGGAGDQGIMVGYATRETREMLPLEFVLARSLCEYIYHFEENESDGKTQVSIDDNGLIKTIVVSWCGLSNGKLKNYIDKWLTIYSMNQKSDDIELLLNPAGEWNVGGFDADTGLTGRKLAIDNYGTSVPFGGGAFSGKDATKVDRSAAYMARHIAVRVLQANPQADECRVRLAYAIGKAEPVEVSVALNGVDVSDEVDLSSLDLTPKGIIKLLDLKKPQFAKTAEFGHFGHNFKWEQKL